MILFSRSWIPLSLLGLLIVCSQQSIAQSIDTIRFDSASYKYRYDLIIDEGYQLEDILMDSSLFNQSVSQLSPQKQQNYWLRMAIYNPSAYSENYHVLLFPPFHNQVYAYDYNAQLWKHSKHGIFGKGTPMNKFMEIPVVLKGEAINLFYIKITLDEVRHSAFSFNPSLRIVKANSRDKTASNVFLYWVIGSWILILFIAYNLVIYLYFKDITYLYYIISLIGGLIYSSSLTGFMTDLLGKFFCRIQVVSPDNFYFYSFNSLALTIGILFSLFGMSYLSRAYLQTATHYPKFDKFFRYYLWATLLQSFFFSIFRMLGVVPLNLHWFLVYENILFFLLICLIFYIGIKSYLDKRRAAIYFLLANVLPLILMLLLSGYFAMYNTLGNTWVLMGIEVFLIGSALTYSIALIGRVNLIKNDLKVAELEAKELSIQNKEIGWTNQLIAAENKQILADIELEKSKNENLELKLEMNNQKLISSTLYITQKNEMLEDLKIQISKLSSAENDKNNTLIKEIKSIINSNLILDASWETFKVHFEQVHPDYFRDLETQYPNLTQNEIRLSAYLHINLSNKEIAALLNIDPASVRKAKTRLNKKINEAEL